MSFIAAAGGERRAPRRAAAEAARNTYCSSSSASPAPAPAPSVKDKERSFDSRVAESRKNGVWGGAEEIQAFCQSFKKDVNVYTEYGIQNFRDVHAPRDEERETMHIAFHVRAASTYFAGLFLILTLIIFFRTSIIIHPCGILMVLTRACRVFLNLTKQPWIALRRRKAT